MNWIQALVVVLMIGGPILGKVAEAVKKQKGKRDAEKAREQNAAESLRTGRRPAHTTTAANPDESAAERMRELARRRQEQLQELRRRQQAARQAAQAKRPTQTRTTTVNAPRPMPSTAPAPPQRVGRQGQSRSTQPTSPTRQPGQRPTQAKQRQSRPQQPPKQRATPTPARPTPQSLADRLHYEVDHDDVHRLVADSPKTKETAPTSLLGKNLSRQDWRRMILAREILGPPVALRSQEQDPGRVP